MNGEYRQVMLSARELSYSDLPSRGWINERLTYTHGFGLVAGPVNRISPEGLPEFFLKDIPPTGARPAEGHPARDLLRRARNDYVFVRTRSQELDYPVGRPERLRALRRDGAASRQLARWRRSRSPLRFGELKVLLSDDLTAESRVMIYRDIGRARAPGGAVPPLRSRSLPRGDRRRPPRLDRRRLHDERPLPVRAARARASTTSATRSRRRWTPTTAP